MSSALRQKHAEGVVRLQGDPVEAVEKLTAKIKEMMG